MSTGASSAGREGDCLSWEHDINHRETTEAFGKASPRDKWGSAGAEEKPRAEGGAG